jgi:hypothetical protein
MITATVKYPAREATQTTRGPRINALVTLPDGQDVKIWANEGDGLVSTWKKGQTVTVRLTKDGKYYDAVPPSEAPATTAQGAPQAPNARQAVDITDPEQYAALQARAMAYADLYRSIHQRLAAGDAQDPLDMYTLPESDLHAAAASVFIAITRGA